jgi:1-aminocyclopropane-1-carboxylate deaminase/D-cysteine desulfhydrase-like pyridoxal-dependent ACC family enzyme
MSYILREKFEEAVLLGSEKSNFVISALQLLNENNIPSHLFLLEAHNRRPVGNSLWLQLLHDVSCIRWVAREDWHLADDLALRAARQSPKKTLLIPTGGAIPQAVLGAMSLAMDILLNQAQLELYFDHVFLDSGTGITAIGAILGFALAASSSLNIHITLVAGTKEEFITNLAHYSQLLSEHYGLRFSSLPKLDFLIPPLNRSFGAVGSTLLSEVRQIARLEGILAEPVYTAKHLFTAREHILNERLSGNILIVNSGGAFGLAGFQDAMAALPLV